MLKGVTCPLEEQFCVLYAKSVGDELYTPNVDEFLSTKTTTTTRALRNFMQFLWDAVECSQNVTS